MIRSLAFLALLFSLTLSAETLHEPSQHEQDSLPLPDDIRALLNREMQEIRKGMESLVFAAAAGNWHDISHTADNIRNSYIMKSELTEKQRHRLHDSLPAQFRELDQKFHHYAGMLSHVAEEHDSDLVHFYIYKMNEACSSCHARFAKHKFSGFAEPNKHMRHSH